MVYWMWSPTAAAAPGVIELTPDYIKNCANYERILFGKSRKFIFKVVQDSSTSASTDSINSSRQTRLSAVWNNNISTQTSINFICERFKPLQEWEFTIKLGWIFPSKAAFALPIPSRWIFRDQVPARWISTSYTEMEKWNRSFLDFKLISNWAHLQTIYRESV